MTAPSHPIIIERCAIDAEKANEHFGRTGEW
jgi:hypothetical protein